MMASMVSIVNSNPKNAHDVQDRKPATTNFQKVPNLNNINQILIDILEAHLILFLLKNHPMYILNIYLDFSAFHQ